MKIVEFSLSLQMFGMFFSILLIAQFSHGVWVKEKELENLLQLANRQADARAWSNALLQRHITTLKKKVVKLEKLIDLADSGSFYAEIDGYSIKTHHNLIKITILLLVNHLINATDTKILNSKLYVFSRLNTLEDDWTTTNKLKNKIVLLETSLTDDIATKKTDLEAKLADLDSATTTSTDALESDLITGITAHS